MIFIHYNSSILEPSYKWYHWPYLCWFRDRRS